MWESWLRARGLVRPIQIEAGKIVERVPWRAVLDAIDPPATSVTVTDATLGPSMPSRQPGAARAEAAEKTPRRRA
jgi:hypothetical protein